MTKPTGVSVRVRGLGKRLQRPQKLDKYRGGELTIIYSCPQTVKTIDFKRVNNAEHENTNIRTPTYRLFTVAG